MHTLTHETVATLIEELAQLLPFPTVLYTDMGADTWTPQLYFGPIDASSKLPVHRVGVDPDDDGLPTWWIDLNSGTETSLLEDIATRDIESVGRVVIALQRSL